MNHGYHHQYRSNFTFAHTVCTVRKLHFFIIFNYTLHSFKKPKLFPLLLRKNTFKQHFKMSEFWPLWCELRRWCPCLDLLCFSPCSIINSLINSLNLDINTKHHWRHEHNFHFEKNLIFSLSFGNLCLELSFLRSLRCRLRSWRSISWSWDSTFWELKQADYSSLLLLSSSVT